MGGFISPPMGVGLIAHLWASDLFNCKGTAFFSYLQIFLIFFFVYFLLYTMYINYTRRYGAERYEDVEEHGVVYL
jgi:hypothetical protein